MFFKIGVLKNFAIFIHRKTLLLESLFNKVAGLKASNFIKRRPKYRCFLRTAFFFIEHLWWLLLEVTVRNCRVYGRLLFEPAEVFVSNFSGQSLLKPYLRKKQPPSFRNHELSIFIRCLCSDQ